MQTTLSQQSALNLSNDEPQPKLVSTVTKNKMKNFSPPQHQSLPLALGISFAVAALAFAAWRLDVFASLQAVLYGTRWMSDASALVAPPVYVAVIVFVLVCLGIGFLVERDGADKILFYGIGFFLLWLAAGAAAAIFLKIDVLAVPAIFAAVLTLFAVQIRPMWHIERQLSDNIQHVATTPHLLEGKRADARMSGGLQLLQTVLPLDEIVVFQVDKNGGLTAIGRSREAITDKMRLKPKHGEWREGVDLCDKSLQSGEAAVQPLNTAEGAARVAVPLLHEGNLLGALMVRFREGFQPNDTVLLTAFADQLARNIQRQDTRDKNRKSSFFDIFSHRAAEHRLESFRLVSGLLTEQQFGSLAFSELPDGYAIAYLDGTLASVNRAMLKAAQITSDRAKQLDLFGLLDRFKGGIFDDPRIAIRRVMQTGEPYCHDIYIEDRNQTLDLQIALVNEPIDDLSENEATTDAPLCFIVTVRDITATKENEKLRSDMVSLMSHELRTPITSINGFAELLMLEDGIPEESQEFLRIISTESQRLSRMLNTFLAVSKLEQGDKREVIKIPIRLDSVVHEVLVDFQPEARKKRIRLVEQANSHLPPVAGDKGLMTKVVKHLIDNAIKYSPERTTITVSTVLEADAVRVLVEDRGYGIPADSFEKIWEKFYRIPREGQDKDETSTGLGLSFVKEVVEQHGGSVFVESEPNQGSRFSFTLPRL